MAKQKTIPELEAEKAENERKLSQLQHKKQPLHGRKNRKSNTNLYTNSGGTYEQEETI